MVGDTDSDSDVVVGMDGNAIAGLTDLIPSVVLLVGRDEQGCLG